jgi:hypothetical protein
MKKQTAVQLIFEKFNLLSNADFKTWVLNNHDSLQAMEKQQIEYAFQDGWLDRLKKKVTQGYEYYNETYGGEQ